MTNEVLTKIRAKKAITIKDHIKFRTIFDVLSALFTDENQISTLHHGYKLNDHQQIWFPNIIPNDKKQITIKSKNGYGNFMSNNWDLIEQFDGTKTKAKRTELGNKYLKNKMQFVTFAKINEVTKGIGYHFIGIFVFDHYLDQDGKIMVYKKIADSYQFS
ncbi:MAG: hypothetical protein REH79_00220 [Spiroplasma sp.]|nr:hypothetical protein [Spiroplasma sp.]